MLRHVTQLVGKVNFVSCPNIPLLQLQFSLPRDCFLTGLVQR